MSGLSGNLGLSYTNFYQPFHTNSIGTETGMFGTSAASVDRNAAIPGIQSGVPTSDAANAATGSESAKTDINPGESAVKKPGKKSSPAECETCKHRKYVDGSNEMVSFKSPAHVAPEAAASAVMAHEGEHVANAYNKAAQNNGKVLQASVAIHTAICPECGRTYVSGGTTTTKISYTNESNPYQHDLKLQDSTKYAGRNFSAAV